MALSLIRTLFKKVKESVTNKRYNGIMQSEIGSTLKDISHTCVCSGLDKVNSIN